MATITQTITCPICKKDMLVAKGKIMYPCHECGIYFDNQGNSLNYEEYEIIKKGTQSEINAIISLKKKQVEKKHRTTCPPFMLSKSSKENISSLTTKELQELLMYCVEKENCGLYCDREMSSIRAKKNFIEEILSEREELC